MSANFITAIVFSVLASLATWAFEENKHAAELAELQLDQANAISQAAEQARTNELAITKTYQGALNAARTRETALRRDVDSARSESDSLRAQSADAARKLASAAPAAVLEYAVAVNELLGQCQREYQGLAGKADGHASDARTLIDAWPAYEASSK